MSVEELATGDWLTAFGAEFVENVTGNRSH